MITALLSALALFASDEAPREHVLPAELCRGFWMLPVDLKPGEDGAVRRLWFLHDTGASRTHVDPDALERLTGRRFSDDQRVNLVEATAGPLSINSLSVRITDLDHLSTTLGREVDGIMSVHALQDFLLILDYPAGQMRIREGVLPRPDGEHVFSTRGPDRRPWLDVDLAGRNERLLIDSGAGGLSFAVNRLDRLPLMAAPQTIQAAVRFDRIEPRPAARLDGDARVAGLTFETPVIEQVERSPLLGAEVLSHFVVTLDQANRRVRLDPAVSGAVAAWDQHELGAALMPDASGFDVLEVFENTPAARAGLREGDRITHFDGRPVRERGCDPLSPGPEGGAVITVARDGEARVIGLDAVPVLPAPTSPAVP
ncbi:MAG: PDZ domain-containing protein [Oceanicaulis sp.]